MLYFNFSQGYRPAGTNRTNKNSDAAPMYYDADELMNYEVGYKYSNPQNTRKFNAAYYLMDWQDMQTAVYDRSLATIQFNTNIGDAKITGLEVDWTFFTENGYTIIIGGSLTDPKLDENFMLNGNLLATSGTQLANVAKRKASLSISKGFTIFNGQEGSWDLNVSRTGKRKSSITNPVNQGAYTIAGLSSTLQGESWDAVLYLSLIHI